MTARNEEQLSSSSEEEGFYKPQINVEEAKEEEEVVQNEQGEDWQANQLIEHNRPNDYLPRVLAQTHPPITYAPEATNWGFGYPQEMVPISREKIKKGKYLSLKDKYQNSELYKLVYSKLQNNDQFTSYIFSLYQTTDYNPKDYQTPLESQLNNNSRFDSRFESGNLLAAFSCEQSKIEEYDLILQNDTNTRGYNQWFFFSFRTEKTKRAKFNIVNLIKKHSLFEEGARPVGLSMADKDKGWHSVGSEFDYQKSYVTREIQSNPPVSKNYYTLSFTIDFPHEQDIFYIAMNYPYTYTKMNHFIDRLGIHRLDLKIDKQILCYTISNNAVPVLRIKHEQYAEGGKKIIVMGRQHPGETVGSYVLEGFLKKIIKEDQLLKQYEIIAIPMVNPDGVIYGNFRTNLAGFDLNRQWLDPDRYMHPEIYSISRFVSSLQNISFVLDFHGHSKKYNSFIFACIGDPAYQFRIYPYIFSKFSPFFSIKDCTYNLTADKQRTARIQIYRAIKKPSVFTLETSFFGFEDINGRKFRLKIKNLLEIGEGAVECLKVYLLRKKEVLAFEKEVKEKESMFQKWAVQIKQDDIESESNPSEDELTPVERKERVIAVKTARKTKPKSKSKAKKKQKHKENSIINLTKLKLATEEKVDLLFQKQPKDLLKKASTGPVVVIKKKIESERKVSLNDSKMKTKKVEKSVSIITPSPSKRPPKPKTFNSDLHSELKLKLELESLPYSQQKRQAEPPKPHVLTSNLFNKPNYFSYFQQKIYQKQSQQKNIHNKTQSLEINNFRKETTNQNSTLEVLKKLIVQEDQERNPPPPPIKKGKEKMYLIRESKIANNSARMNEELIKKNLEEEINSRTEALRNCQRKMHQITFDDPIIRSETDCTALEYLTQHLRHSCPNEPSRLPLIRSQKKTDHFNF